MATEMSELRAEGMPVMVGGVPLFAVTSLVLVEGYESIRIGGSAITQMVRPTNKKITIKAALPGPWRALRPVLEAMALTSRVLAAATAPLLKFTGIPVVSARFFAVDMQIISLTFTQSSERRDTLDVDIALEHVPRVRNVEAFAAGADLAVSVGTAFV